MLITELIRGQRVRLTDGRMGTFNQLAVGYWVELDINGVAVAVDDSMIARAKASLDVESEWETVQNGPR
jgi:hypothetical protein